MIGKLKTDISDKTYIFFIISNCKLLVCNFDMVEFTHACREVNRVAQSLVQLTQVFDFHVSMFWLEPRLIIWL